MSWHRRYERAETIREWMLEHVEGPHYEEIDKEMGTDLESGAIDFFEEIEENPDDRVGPLLLFSPA